MEKWAEVVGYEGQYEVSNTGKVRSILRKNPYGRLCGGKELKIHANRRTGYLQVGLCKNGKCRRWAVHRLVALALIPNTENVETANHKNENKHDNRVENLEWLSLADNLRYGTHDIRAKEDKPDMSGHRHFNYGKRGAASVTHKGAVVGISKLDPNKRVVFDTAATASRALGLSSGQLCEAINGKAKSCGGYYWSRVDG